MKSENKIIVECSIGLNTDKFNEALKRLIETTDTKQSRYSQAYHDHYNKIKKIQEDIEKSMENVRMIFANINSDAFIQSLQNLLRPEPLETLKKIGISIEQSTNEMIKYKVGSVQLKIQLKEARKRKRPYLEIKQLERDLSKALMDERRNK